MPNSTKSWWERAARREDLHWFSYRERAFLLDANSGAVCEIDRVALALLESLAVTGGNASEAQARVARAFSAAEAAEAWDELDELHRRGLFLGPDPLARLDPGLGSQPESNGKAASWPGTTWTKAICLNVAHACNLRCRYCFAGQGRFGGGPQLMSWEVGRAAVDFLLAQAPPGADLEIDFFGGEPLLNFALVRSLILYGLAKSRAEGKALRFTLTTNGLLLDEEKLAFLNEHEVQLILSLDGRPEVHDRCRLLPGSGGSYGAVLPQILRAVASRQGRNYFIRGTFTRYNLDFSRDVAHLLSLGLREISLEPVVADPEEDYALRPEDLPALTLEYDRLVQLFLDELSAGRPFTFFHFQVDLEPGLCLPKRLQGCGAGHQYLAVTPAGEIYPCHQFVGRREFCLGSLAEGITNSRLKEQFAALNVLAKPCRSCWARYFCGGGCHAANLSYGGSLTKPYELGCALMKKRLECAIYLRAAQNRQI